MTMCFFTGIDVGGVSRELFTCVCDTLFGGSVGNGLFTRFDKEDSQALVSSTMAPGFPSQYTCTLGSSLLFFNGAGPPEPQMPTAPQPGPTLL